MIEILFWWNFIGSVPAMLLLCAIVTLVDDIPLKKLMLVTSVLCPVVGAILGVVWVAADWILEGNSQ